ncbi:MAG: hypothetical protein QG657_2811 [Acidobacteriota bacterium]|nr:hypothetical protein [Acidobacteriota bacterium]
MAGLTWLHISDWHQKGEENWPGTKSRHNLSNTGFHFTLESGVSLFITPKRSEIAYLRPDIAPGRCVIAWS